MKTKKFVSHTPGPWVYDGLGDREWVLGPEMESNSGDKLPVYLAEMVYGDEEGLYIKNDTERLANARLMAAAPELLESVKLIIEFLDSLPYGWLGKTSGDIGALNQFYIKSGNALRKAEDR